MKNHLNMYFFFPVIACVSRRSLRMPTCFF